MIVLSNRTIEERVVNVTEIGNQECTTSISNEIKSNIDSLGQITGLVNESVSVTGQFRSLIPGEELMMVKDIDDQKV